MSTTAESPAGLTYTEVLLKMQAKDWLQQPLASFTPEELAALAQSLPNLQGFDSASLLRGDFGLNALAPVAMVFSLLWRHPSLASFRPSSPELVEERHIDEGLKFFHSYVEAEIVARHLEGPNHTGYAALIENFEKLLANDA